MANGAAKHDAGNHRGERSSRLPALFAALSASTATLALALSEDGSPPTEFRLFVSGWNTTENGDFLFDQDAAEATLAAYKTWGVDLMIDLEHQSLNPETPPEPTAKDARGWCNLELRDDGSLWAVNATWTPDGAERLTQKRQRYISPAFGYDADQRVTQILNVAIVAMPATHHTPALMAASTTTSRVAKMSALNPKLVQAALEAVAAKDAKSSLTVLQQILGALLGSAPAADDAPPSSANGGPPDSSATGTPPAPDATASKDAKDSMAAAGRMAMIMTGKSDPGEAMTELARRSKVAVDLEAREATLANDRKALESGERRALVASLVKLGVEIPATAWSDDKGTVPCERLSKEPIAELRTRVEKLTAAGVKGRTEHTTPPGELDTTTGEKEFVTPLGTVKLSAREVAMCAELKVKPEDYAANKAGKKKS